MLRLCLGAPQGTDDPVALFAAVAFSSSRALSLRGFCISGPDELQAVVGA